MAVETKLEMLSHIVRTVQRKQPVKLRDLQESMREKGFPHSNNTIKRAIQKLRELGFSLEYDDEHRTGYYLENNGDYTAHIENFLDSFELFTALNSVRGLSDFVFPEKRRPASLEHLQPLINAIKNSQYVEFRYHKHSNRNDSFLVTEQQNAAIFESKGGDTESLRRVAPYALKEFRGLWYLLGKDDKGRKIKIFGFDRISEINIKSVKFTKDENFDIVARFRDCYGIYTPENSQPEEIILSFDAENGRYLEANPLHSSQETLKNTPEEFIIRLKIHVTLDFLQEILTRTWSLRVISPDSLRLNICEIYKKAFERNRK